MQTEQLAIDFAPPANLQKRLSLASGPAVGTETELHFCNLDQYHAIVGKIQTYFEPTVKSWCGTEIVSGLIYPKITMHVKCEDCWQVYKQLEAQYSGELFDENTDSLDEEESNDSDDTEEEKDDGKMAV